MRKTSKEPAAAAAVNTAPPARRAKESAARSATPPLGLRPADALDWLAVQRAMAWHPERLREALHEGVRPEVLFQVFEKSFVKEVGAGGGGELLVASADRSGEDRLGGTHRVGGPSRVGGSRMSRVRAEGEDAARRDTTWLASVGARVLPFGTAGYPAALAELPDAPVVMLVRGQVAALDSPSVAIVGARAATRSARAEARRLGRELAALGITVVSGLARGIDAEAHRGALEAGGRTVGVLACGVDRIYPPEHRALAEEIALHGAVVSEMPVGTAPRRELFPLRNRIISGLCRAVLVVEARKRSGSLITVRHALGQGREVFVLPGSAEGPFAEGSNQLLREGARAIFSGTDVLEDLGLLPSPGARQESAEGLALDSNQGRPARSDPSEERILAHLDAGAATREELAMSAEPDPSALARALVDLVLAGLLIEERDGRYHLRREALARDR